LSRNRNRLGLRSTAGLSGFTVMCGIPGGYIPSATRSRPRALSQPDRPPGRLRLIRSPRMAPRWARKSVISRGPARIEVRLALLYSFTSSRKEPGGRVRRQEYEMVALSASTMPNPAGGTGLGRTRLTYAARAVLVGMLVTKSGVPKAKTGRK